MNEAEFTVERVAKIAASLDLEPDLRADILGANDLDEVAWERLEDHHDDALRAGIGTGDTSLLERWDAAYLARIEEERGPVTAEEYASIVESNQSGGAAARLAALEIPEAAEMVLVRVFEARMAGSDETSARVRTLDA